MFVFISSCMYCIVALCWPVAFGDCASNSGRQIIWSSAVLAGHFDTRRSTRMRAVSLWAVLAGMVTLTRPVSKAPFGRRRQRRPLLATATAVEMALDVTGRGYHVNLSTVTRALSPCLLSFFLLFGSGGVVGWWSCWHSQPLCGGSVRIVSKKKKKVDPGRSGVTPGSKLDRPGVDPQSISD